MIAKIVLICLAFLAAGCAAYRAAPLVPEQVASAFEGRRLDDPGLKDFLEANLHRKLESWPIQEWTLELATPAAFYYHPDLAVARAQAAVAEAAVVTAGGRPNPKVGWAPEFNADAASAVSPWTLGFTFDVPVETAGKRSDRIHKAQHLSEAARLALGEVSWKVRSRLRAALAEHLFARRELDLLRAEEILRSDLVGRMEEKRATGSVPLQALAEARGKLAETKLTIREAESRLAESRVALAAALGLPGGALERMKFNWPTLDQPLAPDQLPLKALQREAMLNRLDVRQALARYAAAEDALRLEIHKQYPDLHVGPGYTWDQGENKFKLGLSVDLPIFNQNQGPVAEAEARRQEVAAQFLAIQAKAVQDLERALARYQAVFAALAESEETLIRFTRGLEESRNGRAHTMDPLVRTNLLIQRALFTQARLRVLREAQAALGSLEDAVQKPVEPDQK